MNIITIGINHKHTPIAIREKFYLTETERDLLLSDLKNNPAVIEAFVLSTCNRIEIYAHVLDVQMDLTPFLKLIFQIKKQIMQQDLLEHFYHYRGQAAIEHLLTVATSLDSMVIGEKQILGQVKSAFERARERGLFGKYFNILSNSAIRAGKKAHNETDISHGGSSVSWAAIAKAQEIFGSLKDKSIVIIGAGKMSKLAAGQVQNKDFKKLYLMNRTQANAEKLAQQYGGEAVGFSDIKEILTLIDICICSAGAPHHILDKDTVQKIMKLRENRPLLFIDISMPRNIDPKVAEIPGIQLYTIDDLQEFVNHSMKRREKSIHQVQSIIRSKISEFSEKIEKIQPALQS